MRTTTTTPPIVLTALVAVLGTLACSEGGRSAAPRYRVDVVGVEMPQQPGWVQDGQVGLKNADEGGIAFRLVRANAAPGSPRIDVVVEARQPRPTSLTGYENRNLREMAALEDTNKIRITDVEQRRVQIGPRRALRVRHEYTMGGGAVAITQVSIFLVLDGRGVTISAAGRTELFHPLAASIDTVLTGITTPARADPQFKKSGNTARPVPAEPTPAPMPTPTETVPAPSPSGGMKGLPPDVQPIDLGTIGGKDK